MTLDDIRQLIESAVIDAWILDPTSPRIRVVQAIKTATDQLVAAGAIIVKSSDAVHCTTCQCNRRTPSFVPENRSSRSWHGNAPNSPEEANKR